MRHHSFFPSYPLPVVTGQVMATIDHTAIHHHGIPGLTLMEQAGCGIAEEMCKTFSQEDLYHTSIFCGKGNNGGDGFVLARLLAQKNLSPWVALLGNRGDLKGDAKTNCDRLHENGVPVWECRNEEQVEDFFRKISPSHIWVDAILGTGARGAPRGLFAYTIENINTQKQKQTVVAVDIPSGVEADTGNVEGVAVQADWVYTMGLPKIGCLLPSGLDFCKRLVVLDIGFPVELLEEAESSATLLTAREVNKWFPKRAVSSYKGTEGHVLIIAGSRGMTGAALMSAQAAMYTGAGLVTAACPKSLLPIYATSLWEMMTLPVKETAKGSIAKDAFEQLFHSDARWSAVVAGPGISRHPSTMKLIQKIVKEVELPLIIDGDGLFAVTPDFLQKRKSPWVATPHAGEMARLFKVDSKEIHANRLGYANQLVKGSNGCCVLKGPKTVIAASGKNPWINPTGTPAMASGGMGDVLSGMIGSLLAKGCSAVKAASSAVYVHGLAAECAEKKRGAEAVTATQVIKEIQAAIQCVRSWG